LSAPRSWARTALRGSPLDLLLAGALFLFSLGTSFLWYIGFAIAFGSVVIASVARARFPDRAREFAVVVVLAALLVLAARAAGTPGAIVFGGLASLALLAWLAGDPLEVPGGARRAAPSLLIAAFVVGIAGTSALLLPSRDAVVGVAAGLFVFAVVLLAVFFGRPDILDRNRSANP